MNWHEYFTYDAELGQLAWKPRRWSHMAGRTAGYKQRNATGSANVIAVKVSGEIFVAHRIIWEMHHGQVPDGLEIDHIDCNPWNNRLSNLRLATRQQNQWNKPKPSCNKSGYKGVHWSTAKRCFIAQIVDGRKKRHIGQFATAKEAGDAYIREAKVLHGEFFRTDRITLNLPKP